MFGGNDIAGQVKSVTPNANSHSGTEVVVGTDETTNELRIGSVYGGGNGYYTYGTSNDVSASNAAISVVGGVNTVANATSVKNYNGEGSAVATLSAAAAAAVPASVRTFVTIGRNNATNTSPSTYEYIDSVFGGAKNAYLTGATVDGDGTNVIINGGTIYAVFGGNNVGGGQPANTRQLITVNGTKSNTNSVNMGTYSYAYDDGLSRCVGSGTHGIRYLFGGGNAVAAQKVTMNIYGGQIDTCFAGGNSGTVAATTVNVNIGSVTGMTNTPKYDFEHSPYYTP